VTKSAGEHWVCSVLARCGWAVALTRDGLERTDIVAVQTEGPGRQTIEVQVKSIRWMDARGRWQLGVKSQQPALSQHEWYALVMLDPGAPTAAPRTFIVPRDHVAAAASPPTREWACRRGTLGRKNCRNGSCGPLRQINDRLRAAAGEDKSGLLCAGQCTVPRIRSTYGPQVG
jgi:hypothetical protein